MHNKKTLALIVGTLALAAAGCSGSSAASSSGSSGSSSTAATGGTTSSGGTSTTTGGTSGSAQVTFSPQLFNAVVVQASPGFNAGAIVQIASAPVTCGALTAPGGGPFSGVLFEALIDINGGYAVGTYPAGQVTFPDAGTSVTQLNGYVIDAGTVVGGFGVGNGGSITLTDVTSGLVGSIQGPLYITYDFPDGGLQVVDGGTLAVTFNAPWCQ